MNEAKAGIDEAQSRGVSLQEASPEVIAVAHKYIEGYVDALPGVYQRNFGVENGAEIIARFIPVMERWADITAGINSEEELAEFYWTEVLSKVDVDTYGH